LPAIVGSNEFFCLSCRLTAGLDIHGRCATCGSDAVTHPLRYRLFLSAADDCGIREKKGPLELSLETSEESYHDAYQHSGGKFWWYFSKTNPDSNQKGK
jgi:hypothetical protein